jgi:hypothetical protein
LISRVQGERAQTPRRACGLFFELRTADLGANTAPGLWAFFDLRTTDLGANTAPGLWAFFDLRTTDLGANTAPGLCARPCPTV